ncbi:DNA polymerase III subunit delta [Mycoplasma struthionis]|uniref:DNA polymerase III delta N-terminal domain-containing protein n=1 Tax=Mycoplasma struthionis TaxID=538220 RepID=A0A3G8LIW9_9MOLU|nr:hypothetical protein [Mycoplasma struthionis]AZG68832.1 hypothetical protein EGN60_02625 [Mycoplasma struthionis]
MKIIKGEELYLIESEVNKIVELAKKNDANLEIITFNETVDLEELSNQLFSNDFFNNNKIFVLKNLLLFKKLTKEVDKQDAIELIDLLKKAKEMHEILIVLELQKNEESSLNQYYKELLKDSEIINFDKLKEKEIYSFLLNYISKKVLK